MKPPCVDILLATYNGAAHVAEQIGSLHAQTHKNWRLWVSDDGSSDETLDRVVAAANHKLCRLMHGPQAGSAQNFRHLLTRLKHSNYVAFCDQDDVWLPRKLEWALSRLGDMHGPAMYCSDYLVTDASLTPRCSGQIGKWAPSFANALVQNKAAGNTIVLNQAAVDLLQHAAPAAKTIRAHDWWAYLCISAVGGTIYVDPRPGVLYRQHGANAIGARGGWSAKHARLTQLLGGSMQDWIDANLKALAPLRPMMSDENAATLRAFEAFRNRRLMARLTSDMPAKRDNFFETLILKAAV